MVRTLDGNGTVLLCGNGGSAADCQHWAGEMVGRFRRERDAYSFVALTTDTSVITSVANDYDYDSVFSRQVAALGKPGDILVCLSTSGKSPGILKAAQQAHNRKMSVVSFTGKGPNPLSETADHALIVPSTDTARTVSYTHLTLPTN